MNKTKKTEAVETEVVSVETEKSATHKQESETHAENSEQNIPTDVLELMRLYPQYEKLWITSKGFVHPEDAPKYLLTDATLYNNKFYNNSK